MLAPVLAGMVLAYLMQGLVTTLERLRLPGGAAVGLVFALFMGLLVLFIVVVLPLLWHQLITLFNELPGMLAKWQSLLLLLPERYPHLVSDEQVLQAIEVARGEIGKFGQWALTFSLSSLPLLVNIMIYLVLVPILVFKLFSLFHVGSCHQKRQLRALAARPAGEEPSPEDRYLTIETLLQLDSLLIGLSSVVISLIPGVILGLFA